MFRPVVSKLLSQTLEMLEPSIDALVPGSRYSLHMLIFVVESVWSIRPTMAVPVGAIGQEQFADIKSLVQAISADGQVGPVPRRVRTIDPDDITGLNADANLVAKSTSIEFLCVPGFWNSLLVGDCAVSAIDRSQTVVADVSGLPVLPNDLQKETRKGD